jgi:hypothetical protein
VVHGKGTGVLRRVVREMLASHPHVASYRDGEPSEGGAGRRGRLKVRLMATFTPDPARRDPQPGIDIVRAGGRLREPPQGGRELEGALSVPRREDPSFTVNPAKGIFHCYRLGGVGSDAFGFLMRQTS